MFYEKRQVPFQTEVAESYSFLPHLHRDIELLFMLQGEMKVTVDGITRHMQQGDIAVAFPNTIHSYQKLENSGQNYCEVTIFPPDLVSDHQKTLAKFRPVYPFVTGESVHEDVWYLRKHFENLVGRGDATNLLKGYLAVVMSHLLPKLELRPVAHTAATLPIERLLLYIEQHYLEPLSLEELSQAVGVSRYYVSRLFSEKIGYSFTEYLNILRVNYACHLLSTTNQSATDISFGAGFNSASTFYRVFREQLACSPLEYRNAKQENQEESVK